MKNMVALSLLAILGSGCTAKVFVFDQATVIQREAAGEFPDLEKSMDRRALQSGPKMLDRVSLTQEEPPQQAYQILNGEAQSAATSK